MFEIRDRVVIDGVPAEMRYTGHLNGEQGTVVAEATIDGVKNWVVRLDKQELARDDPSYAGHVNVPEEYLRKS